MFHADFFCKTANRPGDSGPLQPRFGSLWHLAFPKTKVTFEREEISNHWWDSGKYDGAADGEWEKCVRSQGAYFEGDWGIIVLCTLFLISCIFFNQCLNFFSFLKRFHLFILEGKGGRKRGRETSMYGCLSCTSLLGPGLQPKNVPWLGIKPATPYFTGQHSIHQATTARALFFSFKDFIYLFLEREEGREKEREKHQCVFASHAPPPHTGDLACNPGMCPDQKSNQWPFGLQAGTQSTEPHQPGLYLSYYVCG